MTYLADTSALVRIIRFQVDPRWNDAADSGLIAGCEPVFTETLTMSRTSTFSEVEERLCTEHPCVAEPSSTWDYVAAMRRDLAKHSMHNMLSVADFLVAAIAMQLKLIVLHEDKDFIAAARLFPQLEQQRISHSLPAA
ncbi:PIN domain-containing protein [Glycomyces xiaoerkulensis]|uniref:PIN domain-containing protein n=1 Tax=Glycomyces xiaoerkulensis TaxID=2038139 RepID=UPI000C25A8CF|nr:PIN domain-containing protein [Glycomyces xiaoerkulensis]